MSAEVVKLVPNEAGETYRIDADSILEKAMGRKWHRLVVVGQVEDEEGLYLVGTANAGESLILMELAKLQIINA